MLRAERRRTSSSRGLLRGGQLREGWGGSCRPAQPRAGSRPGRLGMPPSPYSPASSPLSKCTEAIRHLSFRCRNKQLHSGTWEHFSGGRFAPQGEDWGVRKRCSCHVPLGPWVTLRQATVASPERFSICHLTADLHDKHTSTFGTPRRWV